MTLIIMNEYKCSRLDNDRWGIFCGDRLLATIGSYAEAKHMVRHLQSRAQKPIPSVVSESMIDPGFNQLIPIEIRKRPARRSRKAVS
jgi:hypothetical protein